MKEVGLSLGLSESRISQEQDRIMRKLKGIAQRRERAGLI